MSSVKPYEGSEPYIFISYAHADSPAVMEVVGHLQEAGCRIWYSDANKAYYIYNAAKKRYHSLDRSYTSSSNVPQADDPIPPDAFGRPRTEGRIAYGPLNTAHAGTQVIVQ